MPNLIQETAIKLLSFSSFLPHSLKPPLIGSYNFDVPLILEQTSIDFGLFLELRTIMLEGRDGSYQLRSGMDGVASEDLESFVMGHHHQRNHESSLVVCAL
jgi:hypothetical protein